PIPAAQLPPMNPPASLGVSEAICALALRPSLILVSIGNNDALQTLTFGIPPTDPVTFGQRYALLLGTLHSSGAQIVVSNIPDVSMIPFLVPVPAFKATCPVISPPLPNTVTNADFVVVDLTNPATTTFDICQHYAVRPAALIASARAAVAAYNVIIATVAK